MKTSVDRAKDYTSWLGDNIADVVREYGVREEAAEACILAIRGEALAFRLHSDEPHVYAEAIKTANRQGARRARGGARASGRGVWGRSRHGRGRWPQSGRM